MAGRFLHIVRADALCTARSLGEGERQVVEADQAKVDPANQGKLIHVSGNLATKVPLADPEFGISTPAARLVRTVETYQWKQETHTETHKNFGGSEDKITTYTYVQTWSEPHIESSRFHEPNGHVNPPLRYRHLDVVARDATLGAFRLGEAALRRLAAADEYAVDPAVVTALRDRLGNATVVDGKIFVGADPAKPRIGDLRVAFQVAPVGPVSLIGQQTDAALTEFQTKAGDRLLMARQGSITANDMFKIAEAENRVLTWVLRAVGAVLMLVGWALVGGPLSVLGSVVPLIGDVIGFGTGAVAFLMTAIVVPVVIAIAWLWYRPLVSIVVLAIGFAIVYAIRTRTGRRAVPVPAT